MHWLRQLLGFVSLVSLAGSIATAAVPPSSGISGDAAQHWTADNGNGTYSNPLFFEEFHHYGLFGWARALRVDNP